MASHRERMLDQVKALVLTALPFAKVARNVDKSERIAPGGNVIIRDGDPGEPEVTLSPLSYSYQHTIPLEFAAYESGDRTREAVLDDMLTALGAAIEADRTLGGLAEWVEASAVSPDDLTAPGAETARWTELNLMVAYTTTSPLA